jgi:Diacylglycerol kinase
MIKIIKRVLRSLNYATAGIVKTCKSEFMFRFYSVIYIAVVIIELICGFNPLHIVITLICGSGILSFELINTGVEKTVDAINIHNELTEFAKDASAGAVAFFSLTSVVVVVCIFLIHFGVL